MTWEEMEREARENIEQLLADEWGEPMETEMYVTSFPYLDRMERRYK